jgi:hypothetical protein
MSRLRRAFVLLDVILSITILAIVVVTALRVFHQSISTVRRSDIVSRAVMYADAKMLEFGLEEPEDGRHEGFFGDEAFYDPDLFPDAEDFQWAATVERQEIDYPDVRLAERDEERIMSLTQVHLQVIHDDGAGGFEPWVAVEINTYLMGHERFSQNARRENGLF